MLSWCGSSILPWCTHTRLPILQLSPCLSCSSPIHRFIDHSSLGRPTNSVTQLHSFFKKKPCYKYISIFISNIEKNPKAKSQSITFCISSVSFLYSTKQSTRKSKIILCKSTAQLDADRKSVG